MPTKKVNDISDNGSRGEQPERRIHSDPGASRGNVPLSKQKKADQYDQDNYNYMRYWTGRGYENDAEELAIQRLLKGKHFNHAVDIGGGYGRLCMLLENYADKVTLAEPSQRQLDMAEEYLKNHPSIERKKMQADNLDFKTGSVDLVTMIRVMHHLPDPSSELKELARIVSKDGYVILEMANYAHAKNRLKYALQGKFMPKQPIDIRSPKNRGEEEIPFVNHNPRTFIKQLAHAGLQVERVLSVSNLRSSGLKKLLPRSVMLKAENIMQPALAKTYFGPSIFFLLRKAK